MKLPLNPILNFSTFPNAGQPPQAYSTAPAAPAATAPAAPMAPPAAASVNSRAFWPVGNWRDNCPPALLDVFERIEADAETAYSPIHVLSEPIAELRLEIQRQETRKAQLLLTTPTLRH